MVKQSVHIDFVLDKHIVAPHVFIENELIFRLRQ